MSQKTYRVIQWATGKVGQLSIRHFASNPAFQLVGVLVTNADKVGKDAGEIAGISPVGVAATDDVEAILALDADCVHFAPRVQDIDMICRLLRSGKNVVSPLGPHFPTEHSEADVAKIRAACIVGKSSFHGSGIHPGFAGDVLALTVARLVDRVDHVHVYEIVNFRNHRTTYLEYLGFGRDPDDLRANPKRPPTVTHAFAQSMATVVKGLGKKMEKLTKTEVEFAIATRDIDHLAGVIKTGTVAGQHYSETAWADGAPLVTFHTYWTMGDADVEPNWHCGESQYRIVIDGDPPTELSLRGAPAPDGSRVFPGIVWTAMSCCTAIPLVCDSEPGFISHLDLGVVRPLNLVRRA